MVLEAVDEVDKPPRTMDYRVVGPAAFWGSRAFLNLNRQNRLSDDSRVVRRVRHWQ